MSRRVWLGAVVALLMAGFPAFSRFVPMVAAIPLCGRPLGSEIGPESPPVCPPTVPPPANITVPATSPAGAVVTFAAPTGTDYLGTAFPTICTPPSGSLFPINSTTVTCTGSDQFAQPASVSFTVTVTVTSVAPTVVPDVVTPAINPSGAFVSYGTPVGRDFTGVPVALGCDRQSTSLFPVGTTIVTCSGIDRFGFVVIVTFRVIVMPYAVMSAPPPCTPLVVTTSASGVSVEALPSIGTCGVIIVPPAVPITGPAVYVPAF